MARGGRRPVRAVVIGAGVAGLATASGLLRRGDEVVVVEAAPRAGGVLASARLDGFLVESGATSVRGGGAPVARLLDALGLRDRVVTAAPAASRRLVLRGGRLVAVPAGLPSAWGWGSIARAALEPLVPRDRAPQSVADFLGARFGPLGRSLSDPLMAGIYAGDPALLDAETVLPGPWSWLAEHGSVLGGALRAPPATPPRGSFTFPEGLAELVDALVRDVGPALRLSWPARALVRDGAEWLVVGDRGELRADQVVVTTPPQGLSAALDAAPRVPRAPVASIHVGFRSAPDPRGFGWLCPAAERVDALGVLWVSSTFPGHAPAGGALYRVMVGGTRAPGLVERSDAALADAALALLREVQGVAAAPDLVHVGRALPGIPQYPVGYARALARLPVGAGTGLWLGGWSWGRVGLADGIAAAEGLADRIS